MPDLLFIYGTLHPDRAPAAIAPTARLLRPFGKPPANRATMQGRLYDLGPYPGVVLSDNPSETVEGELFLLPDRLLPNSLHPDIPGVSTVLDRLDEYEDFRPSDPANSLFLRQRAWASLEGGSSHLCWVYTYKNR